MDSKAWRQWTLFGHPAYAAHRIAVASTDFLAADRVSLECMGIDASWPGYLNYAYQPASSVRLTKIDVLAPRSPTSEEVPDARRCGPDAGVARPMLTAAKPGPQSASRKRILRLR